MIKIIRLTFVALIGLSIQAHADTSFRWNNSDANSLLDELGSAISQGMATVLTYLSTDANVNFDAAILLQDSYGDDLFYQAIENAHPLPGFMATQYMTESVDTHEDKYAYAVVLNLEYDTFINTYDGQVENVPTGTWFNVTSLSEAIVAFTPPDTGQTFNPGVVDLREAAGGTQVVPEPTTIGLLSIAGIFTLVTRRFKKRT